MALGAVTSSGDFISHFIGVRVRVNGSGVLRPTLFSQDEVTESTLPTITMATSNRISPLVLANVTEERIILRLQTTAIDEDFQVHRIILFSRPVAVEVPA